MISFSRALADLYPCVRELPSLGDFAHKFRAEGVVVVAVSGDEDAVQYRNFLNDHHVVVGTHRDPSRRISKSFGSYTLPETYLIQDGRICAQGRGWDRLDERRYSFFRAHAARPPLEPYCSAVFQSCPATVEVNSCACRTSGRLEFPAAHAFNNC